LQTVDLLNEHEHLIIQEIIEEFTENGVVNIEMSFDVEQNEQNVLQQNTIDMIIQNLSQFEHITISVTGFQPSCEWLSIIINHSIIISEVAFEI